MPYNTDVPVAPLLFLVLLQTSNAEIIEQAQTAALAGDAARVRTLFAGLQPLSEGETSRLANIVSETMPMHIPLKDREAMLEAIRAAIRQAPTGAEVNMNVSLLRLAESRTLEGLGRHAEALAILDATLPKASAKIRPTLQRFRDQYALIGKPAPALPFTKQLGGFPGLEKYRGKLVVLDFFAHWCKPCIAAFPELKAMYGENHSRGLEIVGVTGYYGYFGARQGLSVADEFAAMQGFYRDKSLPWPVAFVPASVNEAYKILALPNTFVIDRKGIVRYASFGYYPVESPLLRDLVVKLLAE